MKPGYVPLSAEETTELARLVDELSLCDTSIPLYYVRAPLTFTIVLNNHYNFHVIKGEKKGWFSTTHFYGLAVQASIASNLPSEPVGLGPDFNEAKIKVMKLVAEGFFTAVEVGKMKAEPRSDTLD